MDTLETNLSDYVSKSEAKPYEVNLTIKITDMNQLINDLKNLVKNNWKIILLILAIVFFISNYTDIKSSILDGWNNK